MAEKTIKAMKIEFIVDGKEDYSARLKFGNVRANVVAIISKIFNKYSEKADETFANAMGEPKVKSVKLNLDITGKKPIRLKWINVPLAVVVAVEDQFVKAQGEMLIETGKLSA